jgi:hypothetical protein
MSLILGLIPFFIFVFLVFFIVNNWLAISKKEKYDEGTLHHSERIYKNFEFFIKIFFGIITGMGILRLQFYDKSPHIVRQAMIGLGAFSLLTMSAIIIFISTHQASKLRRWKLIEWDTIYYWLEIWLMIFIFICGISIWYAGLYW